MYMQLQYNLTLESDFDCPLLAGEGDGFIRIHEPSISGKVVSWVCIHSLFKRPAHILQPHNSITSRLLCFQLKNVLFCKLDEFNLSDL